MTTESRIKKSEKAAGSKWISTGIPGLDLILHGGYPRGCPTLIRATSGCGKTMFAISFAAADEPASTGAVFLTFDESPERLRSYLNNWGRKSKITFMDVRPDPNTLVSGKYIELTALLIRIEHAIKSTGASCLIIDAIDTLFETFDNKGAVHQGIARIFDWCRKSEITLLATAGESSDYRSGTGLMDYASDCTLLLDQSLDDGLMTRFVRVIKCRGSGHGTNKYPYIIDADGISLSPVTETQMSAKTSSRHLSLGVEKLDQMLGGKGIWAGSTVMVSGQSGTGKSLLAAAVAASACRSGLNVLYFSFEESPSQFIRDVASAGIRLGKFLKSGHLKMISERAVERGMEEHMIRISRHVRDSSPDLVVLDPISALGDMGNCQVFKGIVIRLCHFMKNLGITVVMTELLPDHSDNFSSLNLSSLVDTWIRLRRIEDGGSLSRQIYIHKSRGMKTSNRIETFDITSKGFAIGADNFKSRS